MSKIDFYVKQVAEYISASKLNFRGAEFETDTGDKFSVTISKENFLGQQKEENEALREALRSLVWCCNNNTGHEPSISCYQRALEEAEQLIDYKEE